MNGDSSTTLHSYKVTYEIPEFSIENLKAVKTNEGQETNPYFMTKYTTSQVITTARKRLGCQSYK